MFKTRRRRWDDSEAGQWDDPEIPPEEWMVDVRKIASERWPLMDELQEAIADLDGLRRLAGTLPRGCEWQENPNSWTRVVLHGRVLAQSRVDGLLHQYRQWAAAGVAAPASR